MSRSWWSNVRGAADWATRNKWDFDNMGRPSSVADNNPAGVYDNNDNDGGYKTSWSDAFRAADKWNQGQKGGYTPGYMSGGSFNWPSQGVTKVGANSHLVDPTASWWGKHQIYHHPQKQGGGIGGMIGSIGGTLLGNVVAPGIGGKIGGAIGGQIGSSF